MCIVCFLIVGDGECYYAKNSQGSYTGGWLWHAIFTGDESDAEGDVADRGQADDPVHCGGGSGERD